MKTITSFRPLKQIARLKPKGDLIGWRVDYDASGQIVRSEHFLVPYKKEDEVSVLSTGHE